MAKFTDIHIKVNNGSIVIEEGTFKLPNNVVCNIKDGVLDIVSDLDDVDIAIPSDTYNSLDVSATNGDITVNLEDAHFNKVRYYVSNGDIYLYTDYDELEYGSGQVINNKPILKGHTSKTSFTTSTKKIAGERY